MAHKPDSEQKRTVKRECVVTSHDKPATKVSHFSGDDRAAADIRAVLFARLKMQRAAKAGRWMRNEVYDVAL